MDLENKQISVIVPVYNVEAYLPQCARITILSAENTLAEELIGISLHNSLCSPRKSRGKH